MTELNVNAEPNSVSPTPSAVAGSDNLTDYLFDTKNSSEGPMGGVGIHIGGRKPSHAAVARQILHKLSLADESSENTKPGG